MSLRFPRGLNHPTFTLSADGKLKPFWLKLLRDFPDRFVLGSDAFYTDDSGRRRGVTEEGLANFQTFLAQLPRPLADKIAVENVKSIYPRAFAPAR